MNTSMRDSVFITTLGGLKFSKNPTRIPWNNKAMENGIRSVIKNAPEAPIDDLVA